MDIIQLLSEIIAATLKHGLSLTTLAVALTALLRVQGIRRILTRRLPRRFRSDSRTDRMEAKIDMLLKERGLSWDVGSMSGNNVRGLTNGRTTKSLSPLAASATATIARYFTRFTETYLYQQRRMKMKSKLLSRKFILALATGILVILNDGLDLGLKTDTIMYVVGIVATWIIGESAVDVGRKKPEVADDIKFTTPTESAE